jgi:peroxiredoxin
VVGTKYDVARPTDHRYADYPERQSFLIDPQGTIRKVYEVSDVAAHADDVLRDLKVLQRGS